MTRLEMAYKEYKDGIVYTVGEHNVEIINCCPYFLDYGEDDLDVETKVGSYGKIQGCRGITCEECWNKEL